MLSRSPTEARCSSRACSTTLYWSPPIWKVVTTREPSMVSSALPTLCSDTPRSAALLRSTRTCSCGWRSS